MKKKLFFSVLALLLLATVLWFFSGNQKASLFENSSFGSATPEISAEDWKNAITENNADFFEKNIPANQLDSFQNFLEISPLKIDIEVLNLPKKEVFFSFRGVDKTRLIDGNYAYITPDSALISPRGIFAQSSENSSVFINTSAFPFPLDGEYLLTQDGIDYEVSLTPLEKTSAPMALFPQEKFLIEPNILSENSQKVFLENFKYGLTLSLEK